MALGEYPMDTIHSIRLLSGAETWNGDQLTANQTNCKLKIADSELLIESQGRPFITQ